jgi:hypothetical protein
VDVSMSATHLTAWERSRLPQCSVCGHAYGHEQWKALRLVRRLEASELASVVSPWPPNLAVEARACASCGRVISRVSLASAEEHIAVRRGER